MFGSPRGLFLFALLGFGRICLCAQGVELGIPTGHLDIISHIDFSSDRLTAVTTAHEDKEAIIWDTRKWRPLHHLVGHNKPILSAFFIRNDSFVVTTALDSMVLLWDAFTGKKVALLLKREIPGAIKTPRPEILAVYGYNKRVSLLDTRTLKVLKEKNAKGELKPIQGTDSFLLSVRRVRGKRGRESRKVYSLLNTTSLETIGEVEVNSPGPRDEVFYNSANSNFLFISGSTVVCFNATSKSLRVVSEYKSAGRLYKMHFVSATGVDAMAVTSDSGVFFSSGSDWKKQRKFPVSGRYSFYGHTDSFWVLEQAGKIIFKGIFSDSTFTIYELFQVDKFYYIRSVGDLFVLNNQEILISNSTDLKICKIQEKKVIQVFEAGGSETAEDIILDKKARIIFKIFSDRIEVLSMADGTLKETLNRKHNHVAEEDGKLVSEMVYYPYVYDSIHSEFYFRNEDDKSVKWTIGAGVKILPFELESEDALYLSPGSKFLVVQKTYTINIYTTDSLILVRLIQNEGLIGEKIALLDYPVSWIAYSTSHGRLKIREIITGAMVVDTAAEIDGWIFQFNFDQKIFIYSGDFQVNYRSILGDYFWQEMGGYEGETLGMHMSPDGTKSFIFYDQYIQIAEYEKRLNQFLYRPIFNEEYFLGEYIIKAEYVGDGHYVVVQTEDHNVHLYDAVAHRMFPPLEGINSSILAITVMGDGKVLTAAEDGVLKIWDIASGRCLFTSYTGWGGGNLSYTNTGLFDAPADAFDILYWVKGREIIEFKQLKDRYWEPGLWEKVFAGKELRNVDGLQYIKLQPEIKLKSVDRSAVSVTLIKREGGYGKVSVYVNGKEIMEDARGSDFDTTRKEQTITIDLDGNAYMLDSGENVVTIKTWDSHGFVSSRGENISIHAENTEKKQPAFYAVVCGISKYADPGMELRYSVTDANAITNSLKLAAGNLFHKDSIHIYSIVSDSGLLPNKSNIHRIFEKISTTAKANDVMVVYLSGHGITTSGEGSDFYYLTSDAFSASGEAYTDPEIRKKTAVSSLEFISWMNKIPANKQFMVIDACGSGKAVENLVIKRSVDASQVRAIDRMRDRTGMHIISGCAADAVSYEASVFGQGLLTYSLLEAMKGGALRQQKYLDVNLLMQHAVERVPELAANIGGIQKPQILSPQGAQSFDLGILNFTDWSKIPLAQPKPVFVRSRLFTTDLDDPMNLSAAVNDLMEEMSGQQGGQRLVFFDAFAYPGAWQIKGFYTMRGAVISLELTLKNESTSISKHLEAKNLDELLILIRKEIEDSV